MLTATALAVVLVWTGASSGSRSHETARRTMPIANTWTGAPEVAIGKPFEAVTEETWATTYDGVTRESRHIGTVHVDSAGRTRVEARIDGEGFAVIHDPVLGRGWMVGIPSGEILERMNGKEAVVERSRQPAPPLSVPKEPPTVEQLGTREIEGFTCKGVRRVVKGVGRLAKPDEWEGRDESLGTEDFVVETWTATDLGQPILETRRSEHETMTWRLTSINRRAPSPSLFRAPE